jgi:hypothetical protein
VTGQSGRAAGDPLLETLRVAVDEQIADALTEHSADDTSPARPPPEF